MDITQDHIINGKLFKIKVAHQEEPSDEYLKAVSDKDWFLADILRPFYFEVPKYLVDFNINRIILKENLDSEMERIQNMSPELLETEIRLSLKK